ncbi:RDD family protein [Motiliproteus coralliicola]|uniref:RDD family protein n=1 Tax=Motiliproteus coralliicola TaxID=2283196 RepID=A0A369WWT6_9GAMM|nr:RDD family protein [Motiliproteus coralliicola]RDE25006.1 RDD family protein [Motiliproteus coralliicola]
MTRADADLPNASLIKRLGAMLYDSLLLAALWMVVGAVGVALNNGEAVKGPVFNSALFLVTFLFFMIFWTRSGQTLGMLAWRIRIQTPEGQAISGLQALIRFFSAGLSLLCLGAGYWWMLFDKQGLTWHDRYSESRVVQLPKPKKKS